MFKNAKKVAAPAPAAKGKAAAKTTETFPGLAEVAALEACSKALKGLIETKKAALKEAATEVLIERGLDRHSRPDVMRLAEGDFATGHATVTKRSTTSPLSPDELSFLAEIVPGAEMDDEGNIVAVPGLAETVESVPSMLAVNEAYAKDEALLERIDRALSKVKGVPEDFIVRTEARAKVVASDTATDVVFRLDPSVAEQVFPLIAGVTLGTVFQDLTNAWEIVRPMLMPVDAKKTVSEMLKASLVKETGARS